MNSVYESSDAVPFFYLEHIHPNSFEQELLFNIKMQTMVLSVVHSQINNNNDGTSKAINSVGEDERPGTQRTKTK